ncbi:MAG: hypothetical protein ACI9G1_000444 [Pirellulaceae bacterium]|jgi:hypothetical protein
MVLGALVALFALFAKLRAAITAAVTASTVLLREVLQQELKSYDTIPFDN